MNVYALLIYDQNLLHNTHLNEQVKTLMIVWECVLVHDNTVHVYPCSNVWCM